MILETALAGMLLSAQQAGVARTAVCEVSADKPIVANVGGMKLRPEQVLPVRVHQRDPKTVELHIDAPPAGDDQAAKGFARRLQGATVQEPGSLYGLVELVFVEAENGGRTVDVWQSTAKIGEEHARFRMDLSKPGVRELSASVSSDGGVVKVRASCRAAAFGSAR